MMFVAVVVVIYRGQNFGSEFNAATLWRSRLARNEFIAYAHQPQSSQYRLQVPFGRQRRRRRRPRGSD